MPFIFLAAWLFSIFGPTSSFVINITNSQVDLISHIYNRAQASSISPEILLKILYCESRLNPKARGDYRSESDTYMANGIAQWWKSSWDAYSKKYNFHGNYNSAKDQITLMAMLLGSEENGWLNWKTCALKASI